MWLIYYNILFPKFLLKNNKNITFNFNINCGLYNNS